MQQAEDILNSYLTDTNPEGVIRKTVTDAYGGLKPELEQVSHYENQALPSFYNSWSGYGMGTGAGDMDPMARMQSAAGNVARQGSLAQAARGAFDVRRAGMEDLIGRGLNQWNTGYGMASDAWGRGMQNQQFAQQQEQAAIAQQQWEAQQAEQIRQFNASLALQRETAARQGSGYGSYGELLEKLKLLYAGDAHALYKKDRTDAWQKKSPMPQEAYDPKAWESGYWGEAF